MFPTLELCSSDLYIYLHWSSAFHIYISIYFGALLFRSIYLFTLELCSWDLYIFIYLGGLLFRSEYIFTFELCSSDLYIYLPSSSALQIYIFIYLWALLFRSIYLFTLEICSWDLYIYLPWSSALQIYIFMLNIRRMLVFLQTTKTLNIPRFGIRWINLVFTYFGCCESGHNFSTERS